MIIRRIVACEMPMNEDNVFEDFLAATAEKLFSFVVVHRKSCGHVSTITKKEIVRMLVELLHGEKTVLVVGRQDELFRRVYRNEDELEESYPAPCYELVHQDQPSRILEINLTKFTTQDTQI